MTIQENFNLKNHNTFHIEAKARYFAALSSPEEFKSLLSNEKFQPHPKLILGEGSNLLFTQDFNGLVIKTAIKGIEIIKEDENYVILKAGAGETWHELVLYCIDQGYWGLENLSLIPGTVGAAPIQNIGAYGTELKDVFLQLNAIHLATGAIHTFQKEDCEFGYRDSIFKNKLKNEYAILSITLRLSKKPIYHLEYGNIQETLHQMQATSPPSLKDISQAIIQIRRSKLPDPKELGNAGSFFKNPIIGHDHFVELQKQHPNLPSFSVTQPDVKKISAAWLIEQCGWKGKRVGEIGVYEKQALILVNYGAGTGNEIKNLALAIQKSVDDMFHIALVPEVNFI